jgi:DNA-binding NtrC family response regulator
VIFVVEDDPALNRLVGDYLATSGHAVERYDRAETALAAAREAAPDVLLTDVQLPGMSGLELVAEVGRLDPGVLKVVMTAHGSVQVAVEAMRAGAFEFVEKPVDLARLVRLIERALSERRTQRELSWVRMSADEELLGASPGMVELKAQLASLARLPAGGPPVLIQGETGVGKGAVARTLHRLRFGDDAPWLDVNCAALPATLIEAELFGFERSAFTDARQAKPGLFEAADGGTLFLDEVGELPLESQAKLLKVLESGTVRRLGALKERRVRVSVIAASNVDLERASREGRFRPDLYQRLAALPLFIPPLRARGDDVVLLAPGPSCANRARAFDASRRHSQMRCTRSCARITGRATCASSSSRSSERCCSRRQARLSWCRFQGWEHLRRRRSSRRPPPGVCGSSCPPEALRSRRSSGRFSSGRCSWRGEMSARPLGCWTSRETPFATGCASMGSSHTSRRMGEVTHRGLGHDTRRRLACACSSLN